MCNIDDMKLNQLISKAPWKQSQSETINEGRLIDMSSPASGTETTGTNSTQGYGIEQPDFRGDLQGIEHEMLLEFAKTVLMFPSNQSQDGHILLVVPPEDADSFMQMVHVIARLIQQIGRQPPAA